MLVGLLAVLIAVPGSSLHPRAHLAPPLPAVARRIGDAEILGTLGTADANEVEAAKLASTKAHSQEVRDYANMLLRDHQQSLNLGLQLAKDLGIAPILPSDSAMARAHKQEMDQLNLISAAAFDKAFLQYMVADHKMVINKVNTVLLPGASHPELKAFIRKLQPTLAMHEAKGQALLDKQK
jgi:putative membrane protein